MYFNNLTHLITGTITKLQHFATLTKRRECEDTVNERKRLKQEVQEPRSI